MTKPWYSFAWRWMTRRPQAQLAQAYRRQLPPKPSPGSQYEFQSDLERSTGLSTTALSLATLFTSYDDADNGYPATMIDLFEKAIEKDAHLRSLIDDRLGVARKEWTIQEGGDAPEDKEAAVLLETALRVLPNLSTTLTHQLMANLYGWSGSETDWQVVDGVIVPARFANPAHRRFVFDVDTDQPRLITDISDIAGDALIPGKWWYSRRWGRLATSSGLMRTATIWSYFKSLSMRDWLVFADRFGIPYVVGTYEERASDEDKAVLDSAVANLGSDGYATFSDACNIVIHAVQSGGSTDVHGKLVTLCDAQISKLIAGATLTSETTGQASYAIGAIHESRGFDIKKGDAEWLAETFEECVGRPFVKFNNLKGKAPRLRIYLDLDVTVKEFIEIADLCVNKLGMPVDEDQIRRKTTLRRPTGAALTGTAQGGTDDARPEDS